MVGGQEEMIVDYRLGLNLAIRLNNIITLNSCQINVLTVALDARSLIVCRHSSRVA